MSAVSEWNNEIRRTMAEYLDAVARNAPIDKVMRALDELNRARVGISKAEWAKRRRRMEELDVHL